MTGKIEKNAIKVLINGCPEMENRERARNLIERPTETTHKNLRTTVLDLG